MESPMISSNLVNICFMFCSMAIIAGNSFRLCRNPDEYYNKSNKVISRGYRNKLTELSKENWIIAQRIFFKSYAVALIILIIYALFFLKFNFLLSKTYMKQYTYFQLQSLDHILLIPNILFLVSTIIGYIVINVKLRMKSK